MFQSCLLFQIFLVKTSYYDRCNVGYLCYEPQSNKSLLFSFFFFLILLSDWLASSSCISVSFVSTLPPPSTSLDFWDFKTQIQHHDLRPTHRKWVSARNLSNAKKRALSYRSCYSASVASNRALPTTEGFLLMQGKRSSRSALTLSNLLKKTNCCSLSLCSRLQTFHPSTLRPTPPVERSKQVQQDTKPQRCNPR